MLPYSKLPPTPWKKIGMNAGVLLAAFDLQTGAADRSNIIGATEGPVRFTARPRLIDLGAGVKNCPKNARELLVVDGWEVRLSGTFVTTDTPASRRLMAICDAQSNRLTPRGAVDPAADFGEVWFMFDYGDVHDGPTPGRYVIHIPHALATGGLAVQTGDGQRTRWPFEFTAFGSVEEEGEGFEVWVCGGERGES